MESNSSTFMIDIRRFRVLRELRERGTIGATAIALRLTPSAISQQIAGLSREVGVPLLTPNGRGVRLTQQAQLLLDHAAAVDAQLERARADLAAFDEGTVGRVAVGAFATAISGLIAPALARLHRERPRLRLSIQELEAPESFTFLDRGDLDLVVTVDYRDGPKLTDARYFRQDLIDDPLLVALPESHPLANRKSIDLLALADQPWIFGARRGPCQEAGLVACATAGFSPDIAYQVNDWGALLSLVKAGCGVALIPKLAVGDLKLRGVVLRPPSGPQSPSRHIYAAIRAGAEKSPFIVPALSALVAIAKEYSTPPGPTPRASRRPR